jgi:hypothetical protein
MNKVVRNQGPASDLPERYRGDIDPAHTVSVTVEEITDTRPPRLIREILQQAPGGNVTIEEAVARIRKMRDEWDN